MKRAFTLIEIIMAMAIMAVGIIGVVRLLPVGLRASKSSEMISKAAFLAQKQLEQLKLAGFDALIEDTPSVPLEGEEGNYSWQAEISEVSLAGLMSSEDIRQLTLIVSWQQTGRTQSETFATYIAK